MRLRGAAVGALLLLTLMAGWSASSFGADQSAQDKNGVSPNSISLPSGPGSIEGLGESFQPMLNTGTARYQVPIAVPAGVAGHTPELALRYDSGLGEGPASLGWTYGPGAISRRTDKGIPRYVDGDNGIDDDQDGRVDEPDEVDLLVGPDGEELVVLGNDIYRARIEGNFARYRRVGAHWEVDLKSGTRLVFGRTPEARISDADGERIFRWLLEESADPNGNLIVYRYDDHPTSTNQRYLTEIRYGPGAPPWSAVYFIAFSYEPKPDWRKDYRSGFLVKTAQRLARIDIGIQGGGPGQGAVGDWNSDGTPDRLIRRYTLAYDDSGSPVAQLKQVTRFGADGVNSLPPATFGYSAYLPPRTLSAADALVRSANAPESVMDNARVDLVDLNRDALPDILKTDLYGGSHIAYRNLGPSGEGEGALIRWADPQAITGADGLAERLHLAEDRVTLADMNGDGISDLSHTSLAQEVRYFPNRGDFSWGASTPMSIQDSAPPAPHASDAVKTLDLDFNKRMDVVMSTDNGYAVWYNYADGTYSREVRTPGASDLGRVMLFSEQGFEFADLNGDRLSDAARVTPTRVIYAASMGHGQFAEAVAIPIPDTVLTDGENGQVARAKLTDVNGDGLADLVVERAAPNALWFWLNRGTDAWSGRYTVTDMPTQYGPDTAVRWADLNGNGTTDLIYADSTAAERIWMLDLGRLGAGSAHPNLITEIGNGLGLITTISYRSSTEHYLQAAEAGEPWISTVPFPVPVVSRVVTTTGLDSDTLPGPDAYRKDYLYRDGFYEDREHQFRGFAQVEVTEHGDPTAPTQVTDHRFYTGGPDGTDNDGDGSTDEVSPEHHREEDALKGMVRSLEVRSQTGTLFSREENAWRVRNLLVNPNGIEVRFAYNTEANMLIFEGSGTSETVRSAFAYDDYGNITQERSYGALSIAGDERFTFTEYAYDTDRWILSQPMRQHQTDGAGAKVAETRSYYDGDDYMGLPLGAVEQGNLTRQEGWVKDDRYVNVIRSGYDAYGNIAGIKDGNGNLRTVQYDPVLHAFPTVETVHLGGGSPDLSLSVDYDLGLGTVTESRDFNGHRTTYGHDTFGRLVHIVRPGDTAEHPTLAVAYTPSDPARGLVYHYDVQGTLTLEEGPVVPSAVKTWAREQSGQPGTFDSIAYVDGLGRKLGMIEEAEQGFIVKEAVRFNGRASPRYAFLPYRAESPAYQAPSPSNHYLETHYDATGRAILRIKPPDQEGQITQATTAYLPLQTTVTDEKGNLKTVVSDGLERQIEVRELNDDEILVTRYAYDPLDNLTRLTDPQNNVTTSRYDGLSRQIETDNPDRGKTLLEYDAAGNLLETTDNKGQVIRYTYDGANRMRTEDYLDDAGLAPDVSYHYDLSSPDYPAASNLKGKLAWIEDLTGGLFLAYDRRGNTTWSIKRVRDGETVSDYRTEVTYDAMDRQTSIAYPDESLVEYRYNARSLLESIPGLVHNLDYHPSGQIATITHANGVQSQYAYDPRQRLTQLQTTSALRGSQVLQDLSYVMDGVSNIKSITDGRALASGSPKNATQSFLYDDLYRLTQAKGPGYGAIEYRYDKVGNLTWKGSPAEPDPKHIDDPLMNLGRMSYGGAAGSSGRAGRAPGDPPGPHALTATESGLAYDYDDNGNMVTHAQGDVYAWDFKDRLVRTEKGGLVAQYGYDHANQRIIKKVRGGSGEKATYYVSKAYEIRDGRSVKYVFAGDRRVARIDEEYWHSNGRRRQTLAFNAGWNFFSLQVQPDDPAIGSVLREIESAVQSIWAFDAQAQQYQGYVPGEGRFDFSELHAQRGYAAYLASPATMMVDGTPSEADIPLAPGWNLVGAPARRSVVALDSALAPLAGNLQSVWFYEATEGQWRRYDPNAPEFLNDLQVMAPGNAYWIHVAAEDTLAYSSAPAAYFYHPDHLGSSNAVTDMEGEVAESVEFYPYGRARHTERVAVDSYYGFTGKELDDATGLHYFEARYYDSVVGRFVSVDPVLDGINWYGYTNNNPINRIDPTGLEYIPDQDWYPDTDEHNKITFSKMKKNWKDFVNNDFIGDVNKQRKRYIKEMGEGWGRLLDHVTREIFRFGYLESYQDVKEGFEFEKAKENYKNELDKSKGYISIGTFSSWNEAAAINRCAAAKECGFEAEIYAGNNDGYFRVVIETNNVEDTMSKLEENKNRIFDAKNKKDFPWVFQRAGEN